MGPGKDGKEVHGEVGSLHGDRQPPHTLVLMVRTEPAGTPGAPLPGLLLSVLRGSPGSGSAREHLHLEEGQTVHGARARDMLLGYQATGHPKEPV